MEENFTFAPPEITEAKESTYNLLPEQSKHKYEQTYTNFINWQSLKNKTSFSENVLLAYFNELSMKYKAASLWTFYSMLRSTLNINNNVQINKYFKLRAFLKRKSEGVQVKKTKTFSPEEINKFINEAPDNIYLITKVALIMGIMGACRSQELHSMTVEDIQDLGSIMIVTVPKTKTKIVRKFTVTGKLYMICKKYSDLRPPNVASRSYFLNYQKGKCTSQNIGINKFGGMGQQVAKFLNLPDAKMYTGYCFRRSSATILIDAAGDIITLKQAGRWKSTVAAERYIDQAMENPTQTGSIIPSSLNTNTLQETSTASTTPTSKAESTIFEHNEVEEEEKWRPIPNVNLYPQTENAEPPMPNANIYNHTEIAVPAPNINMYPIQEIAMPDPNVDIYPMPEIPSPAEEEEEILDRSPPSTPKSPRLTNLNSTNRIKGSDKMWYKLVRAKCELVAIKKKAFLDEHELKMRNLSELHDVQMETARVMLAIKKKTYSALTGVNGEQLNTDSGNCDMNININQLRFKRPLEVRDYINNISFADAKRRTSNPNGQQTIINSKTGASDCDGKNLQDFDIEQIVIKEENVDLDSL